MKGMAFGRAAWLVLALIIAAVATVPARAAEGVTGKDIVVLETGGTYGISIRLAEDLASLVDDGETRRILPVVGQGGVENVADLMQTPGIDMAILQLDVLDYARTQKLLPDLDNLSYIAKLNYVEFHLLARQEVATVADLAGKTVSVGQPLGNTAITTGQLFKLLHVSATLTNDAPDVAVAKVAAGRHRRGRLRRRQAGAVAAHAANPGAASAVHPADSRR